MAKLNVPTPVLSDPFSIAGLEVCFWVGFKEGVLEGGFEVGDLDMGPDMVDVGAEGTGGTGLGGGNPKPRSASESLSNGHWSAMKGEKKTYSKYITWLKQDAV